MPTVSTKRLAALERAERETGDYYRAARILSARQPSILEAHDDPWQAGWIAFARAWRDAIVEATGERMDREARASDV